MGEVKVSLYRVELRITPGSPTGLRGSGKVDRLDSWGVSRHVLCGRRFYADGGLWAD